MLQGMTSYPIVPDRVDRDFRRAGMRPLSTAVGFRGYPAV